VHSHITYGIQLYANTAANVTETVLIADFYRAMPRRARYWRIATVSLSVRLSVTLRYRDHIGWNFSKIISPLVSLGCSLCADPNITDLHQGEHPTARSISAGETYSTMCRMCRWCWSFSYIAWFEINRSNFDKDMREKTI